MLADLLDLVLPGSCAACLEPGPDLCRSCRGRLVGPVLGLHRPTPCPPGLPRLAAAVPYADVASAALLAHKERGRLALAGPLGEALAAAVLALELPALTTGPPSGPGPSPVLLVPVPSSRAAVRQRGQDHARRLAAAAAAALRRQGVPARAAPVLVQARSTADQSGLSTRERAANLQGALRLRRPLPRWGQVVLVDDVVTTGATLVEAARAVAAGGRPAVAAAVVAATQRQPRGGAHPAGAGAPRGPGLASW